MLKSNYKKICELTKKHPNWQSVFLEWAEFDDHLDFTKLKNSFDTLTEYKHLLRYDITIEFAKSLVRFNDETNRDIIEIFNDKIQEVLHTKQKDNFIKSLSTHKYKYLFDDLVVQEINIILDHGISISALKNQFFNKLAWFKSGSDLLADLLEFKDKHIIWDCKHYLEKIKNEKLNVTILKSTKYSLTLVVNDWHACKKLGSQSWCIVHDEGYFESYISDVNRQVIYFNFELNLDDDFSLIGFTIDMAGNIIDSYIKDDSPTPKSMYDSFNFPKLNKNDIKNILNNQSCQNALIIICRYNLIDHFNEWAERISIDITFEDNTLFKTCILNKNIELAKRLLKYDSVRDNIHTNGIMKHAILSKDIDTVDFALGLEGVTLNPKDYSLFNDAFNSGCPDIVDRIIKEESLDPSINNSEVLTLSIRHSFEDITLYLLKDSRINIFTNDHFAFRWAIKYKDYFLLTTLLEHRMFLELDVTKQGNILKLICDFGDIESIKIILSHDLFQSNFMKIYAIQKFSREGKAEHLNQILNQIKLDSKHYHPVAFLSSVDGGHEEVVKLFLKDPQLNPSAFNNQAIRSAASAGCVKVTALLMDDKRVDPTINENSLLRLALINNKFDIVNLLLTNKQIIDSINNEWINKLPKSKQEILNSTLNNMKIILQ
jgi:hypothetical protein